MTPRVDLGLDDGAHLLVTRIAPTLDVHLP